MSHTRAWPFCSGYIGEFELVDDHRSGKIVVELTGRINKCGVVSPRFDVPLRDIEKWVGNLLPSRQVRVSAWLCFICPSAHMLFASTVRSGCPDHHLRYHGPRGGPP